MPGLDPRRADLIVSGAVLLDTILRQLGAEEITLCDLALREGLVLDYIKTNRRQIAQVATQLWDSQRLYLADLRQVLQVRDTALVLAGRAINVVRRDDGSWRYAISLLDLQKATRAR